MAMIEVIVTESKQLNQQETPLDAVWWYMHNTLETITLTGA